MKITNNRSGCTISTTLDLFGDRWSLLIIRDLFLRRTTFTQFLNAPEKIATNILRDRLKKLMSYGIIKFQIDQNDKKIKKYFLTDKGIDLYPIVYQMIIWSTKHLEFEQLPISIEWLEKNKNKTSKAILKEETQRYLSFREKIMNGN